MAVMARVEPGISPRSPRWVAGVQSPGPHSASFPKPSARALHWKWRTQDTNQRSYWMPVSQRAASSALPQNLAQAFISCHLSESLGLCRVGPIQLTQDTTHSPALKYTKKKTNTFLLPLPSLGTHSWFTIIKSSHHSPALLGQETSVKTNLKFVAFFPSIHYFTSPLLG